jgi:hypothetical protein
MDRVPTKKAPESSPAEKAHTTGRWALGRNIISCAQRSRSKALAVHLVSWHRQG